MAIRCSFCKREMTEFVSQDKKSIFMCPCCGEIHLPVQTRNNKVKDYTYNKTYGIFMSSGDMPTDSQVSYLRFLLSELHKTYDIYSLTKREAGVLISSLKDEYENKGCCEVFGQKIKIVQEDQDKSVWFRGFADFEVTDKQWVEDYKNTLHPNDDWTNMNVATYGRWLAKINNQERHDLFDAAHKAGLLGFVE